MEKLRLDKILADSGFCSRKEAARLIREGAVTVGGDAADSGAAKYDPETTEITVGGTRLEYKRKHYIMMNKPAGVVSATEDRSEKTVLDLLGPREKRLGLFPAGRLDKDAEGLLILTNDGDYVHRIITPAKNIWKTYEVETAGVLDSEDAAAFRQGIELKDGLRCLPAVLEILRSGETSTATVRIREGKYHQVKRMLASRGKPVLFLKRLSIGGLRLDGSLAPGSCREMTLLETESVFQGEDSMPRTNS
jgi:16S rRNA pseudouridine516 synthase